MVRVDKQKCNGCAGRDTTLCQDICPGLLWRRGDDGKAEIRDQSACWDCCACVKACPRTAITQELPFQICEAQHQLTARTRRKVTVFRIHDRDGVEIREAIVPAQEKT
jgi:adenylylsulfate reductase subunit B